MTKQEAIEILRDTPIDIRSTREDDIHTLYATAQGMAIEALTHFNSTSNSIKNELNELSCSAFPNRSDLIRRQDAIDALMEIMDRPKHAEFLYTDEICKALNELPSAQLEIIQCKDCYWWEKQEASLQGRCDRYGFYPTGYWYCAGARERKDNG